MTLHARAASGSSRPEPFGADSSGPAVGHGYLDFDLDLLLDAAPDDGGASAARLRAPGAHGVLADPEISTWLDDPADVSGASRPGAWMHDPEIEAQIAGLESTGPELTGTTGSVMTSTGARSAGHGYEDYLEAQAALHSALLYDDESGLVHEIAGFLRQGLADGDIAVIVATPDRWAGVEQALPADALARAEEQGRLVILDARETLDRFLRDGDVDAGLFERHVAAPFRALTRGSSWVTAYGQMTALLWEAGDVTGALRLEQLWGDLQRDVPFSMLCAYPSSDVLDEPEVLPELCSSHTHVHALV